MSSELSLSQILANLEAQIDLHRKREIFHAERELFHREQREVEAAELAAVIQSYEALKAVAGPAAEIAARVVPAPAPPPQEELPAGTKIGRKLVERVLADLPADEDFGPSRIAAELNRRYGKSLPKPADARFASTALRRLLDDGGIRLVRKGTPHHEALYRKA